MATDTQIQHAARELAGGGLVAIPTETVYGLAADANNDEAVSKIFTTKGRPADHPLIVHVVNAQAVQHFAQNLPPFAALLMQAFWPGPLTLIVSRRTGVAVGATAGQGSVGVRCPAHPVAQALLQHCQTLGVWGLAAPSANPFGRISPTTSAHVRADFGQALTVLEGGPCAVGIESTIVDCSRGHPVLLRPGVVSVPDLERVLGQRVWRDYETLPSDGQTQAAPKASGTLASHYAPRARLYCLPLDELLALLQDANPQGPVALYTFDRPAGLPPYVQWVAMPRDPVACAQTLFSQLRAFDVPGVHAIWVQCPPNTSLWEGVRDRLGRASAIPGHPSS
jgi:L-threonylcarbamoyladenylate synthase